MAQTEARKASKGSETFAGHFFASLASFCSHSHFSAIRCDGCGSRLRCISCLAGD
jgi:hypothetical protein